MRVLLSSSLGGAGHLVPVTSIGQRLARAGHEVAVLVPPSLECAAADTGLAVVVGDEPEGATVDEIRDRLAASLPEAVVGLVDRELFARRCTPAMLPAANRAVAALRPDLVLREPCEYAAAIAARGAGVPFATVAISLARIEGSVLDSVCDVLDGFAAGTTASIREAPFLSAFPERLDPSAWSRTVRYRIAPPPDVAPLPGWWRDEHHPLLLVTFGSVVGHTALAPRVFAAVLEAVERLEARVLLTVGRDVDPGDLGAVPRNVHVERWVDQWAVLGACRAVVCHGGSGTTYGALRAGVPVVVCPLFADNARNGEVVAACGAGLVAPTFAERLRADDVDGAARELRVAAASVLSTEGFGEVARRIASEVRGYPAPEEVLAEVSR